MVDDTFTRTLRERRRDRDLTQAELARAAGCATVTLKRIEAGDLRPSRQLAERLLWALDVPTEERATLVRLARRASPELTRNPYKGLRAFDVADADDFFGREVLVAALLRRLAAPVESPDGSARFLAVVGPSGCGKSSVVRAGLIPALRAEALPGSTHWPLAVMTPGPAPLEALDEATRTLADARSGGLLLVDQAEELWTLSPDEAVRRTVLCRLCELALRPDGPWVVLTLRADFYDRPLQDHSFGTLVRAATEVMLPLAPDELARAVVGPAELSGLSVEPALLAAIVTDIEQRPGALPLLQYALTELFERRSVVRLTLASYLEIGGVAGALAGRADELYGALDGETRPLARQLFLSLVQIGEGGQVTRRRARASDMPNDDGRIALVVERFTAHRLLTRDCEPATRAATVELAHEALIDSWELLRGWIDGHRDQLHLRRSLALATGEWLAAGRDPGFLAVGPRLAQLEQLDKAGPNADERAFLEASAVERGRAEAAERAGQERLRESLARSEAQRLAAEAGRLVRDGGSAELAALLALRSLELRGTTQGVEALYAVAQRDLPVRHFVGHSGRLYTVAYAPDGRSVVAGGQDCVVLQWEVTSGALLRRLEGHTGNIEKLAFSSDGRLLASAASDKSVRLWDAATGALRAVLPHPAGLRAAVFAPDGRRLLTFGRFPFLQIWDITNGALLQRFDTSAPLVIAAVFAPDGASILAHLVDGRTISWRIGDIAAETILPECVHAASITISPDGQLLLTSHPIQFTARLWNAATGKPLRSFTGHRDMVHYATFTPDGARVITSSNDASARVYDVMTGAELQCLAGHSNSIWEHALSPEGRFLLTGGTDGAASLWDLAYGPDLPTLRGHQAGVIAADIADGGRTLFTVGDDLTIRGWDGATGAERACWRLIPAFTTHGGLELIAGGPHAVIGCNDGVVRVVNLAAGEVGRALHGHRDRVWGVAASPDGSRLLSASGDCTARLWNTASGEPLAVLEGHTDLVVGAAFTPDGRFAVTGSDDGTVRLWDVADGREVHRLVDPRFPMTCVAVTPDGRSVLTGSADGTVRLWEIASGHERWRAAGHRGYLNTARTSADGRLGLTAGSDRTARLWDLAEGRELQRYAGHAGGVNAALFVPGGRHILTASADGTVRIWHLDWRDVARALRGRLRRELTLEEQIQYGTADDD